MSIDARAVGEKVAGEYYFTGTAGFRTLSREVEKAILDAQKPEPVKTLGEVVAEEKIRKNGQHVLWIDGGSSVPTIISIADCDEHANNRVKWLRAYVGNLVNSDRADAAKQERDRCKRIVDRYVLSYGLKNKIDLDVDP